MSLKLVLLRNAVLLCAGLAPTACLAPDSASGRRAGPGSADASPSDVAMPADSTPRDAPASDLPLLPDMRDTSMFVSRPAACSEAASGTLKPVASLVRATAAAGALVDVEVAVIDGALAADVEVTLTCADDLVSEGFVALGHAVSITTSSPITLAKRARVTLVFDAFALPERIESRHLRLFWKPSNYNFVSQPPVQDPIATLPLGTFSFATPAFGTFQLGYAQDAGEPVERRFTYRAISGVSMGAGAAAYLGTKYHDQFDYIVPLGGLVDQPYMLNYISKRLLGGFCREGEGAGIGAYCGLPDPTTPYEHPSHYLYWYHDDSDGAGGNFDRNEYLKIFQDLSYAYGNLLVYNPESPYLPPGVPAEDILRSASERCDGLTSRRIAAGRFFDDEYNPRAEFSVIAFCDGEDGDPRGVLESAPGSTPIEVGLAVDVNGNGVRDLHEPVIRNLSEPYDDVGCDGISSADEVGYDAVQNPDPASDDYDWYRNPTGREGNFVYDDCSGTAEPYRDFGLDGVDATPQFADGGFDFGERNGQFDYNPNVSKYLERNPGFLYRNLPPEARARLRFWTDGGLRDLFNFAIDGAHLTGHLQGAGDNVRVYNDFPSLLRDRGAGAFPFFPDATRKDAFGQMGNSLFITYGNPDADAIDISLGDGAHVGTVPQALNRFMGFFDWIHNRWPGGDYTPVYGAFEREDKVVFFDSAHFGKRFRYGISLPPGYGVPENAGVRYPVLLVLHGYGQGPEDLPVTGALLASQMAGGAWQKSIVVFPEGFCGNASVFQCNDGLDNDGDGTVDSVNDEGLRQPCTNSNECAGVYACREGTCCPPWLTDCAPVDTTCGLNHKARSEDGVPVTLCADGVDNDRDGLTDLLDEGCLGDPTQDTEADCKKGGFYTTHVAKKDGSPGGPDFEGALLDMLEHLDANYRTKAPETVTVKR